MAGVKKVEFPCDVVVVPSTVYGRVSSTKTRGIMYFKGILKKKVCREHGKVKYKISKPIVK